MRDREASLRRRLLEHYSSVMSWEVRRLTRITTDIQSRLDSQSHKLSTFDQREQELVRQLDEGRAKTEELETMVLELGRREKGIEEEARELEAQRDDLEREKATWAHEREQLLSERQTWLEHSRGWNKQVAEFNQDRHNWAQEKEALLAERERLMQNGQTSEQDRQMKDHVRTVLGSLRGRRGEPIQEEEIVPAFEDLKKLLAARETEVLSLREEMREVNMGLEEEIRRVTEDRDAWKAKLEKGEALRKEEVTSLERSLRVSSPVGIRCKMALTCRDSNSKTRSQTLLSETNPFLHRCLLLKRTFPVWPRLPHLRLPTSVYKRSLLSLRRLLRNLHPSGLFYRLDPSERKPISLTLALVLPTELLRPLPTTSTLRLCKNYTTHVRGRGLGVLPKQLKGLRDWSRMGGFWWIEL